MTDRIEGSIVLPPTLEERLSAEVAGGLPVRSRMVMPEVSPRRGPPRYGWEYQAPAVPPPRSFRSVRIPKCAGCLGTEGQNRGTVSARPKCNRSNVRLVPVPMGPAGTQKFMKPAGLRARCGADTHVCFAPTHPGAWRGVYSASGGEGVFEAAYLRLRRGSASRASSVSRFSWRPMTMR